LAARQKTREGSPVLADIGDISLRQKDLNPLLNWGGRRESNADIK